MVISPPHAAVDATQPPPVAPPQQPAVGPTVVAALAPAYPAAHCATIAATHAPAYAPALHPGLILPDASQPCHSFTNPSRRPALAAHTPALPLPVTPAQRATDVAAYRSADPPAQLSGL